MRSGAHTVNEVPHAPSCSRTWAPRTFHSCSWRALADEVHVDLAEDRRVAVRVVGHVVGAVVVGGHQVVAAGIACPHSLPDAAADVLERHLGAVGEDGGDALGERAPGAHGPFRFASRVGTRMDAEHRVRVVIGAGRDGVEQLVIEGAHRDSFTWRMWTGSAKASSRTKL